MLRVNRLYKGVSKKSVFENAESPAGLIKGLCPFTPLNIEFLKFPINKFNKRRK